MGSAAFNLLLVTGISIMMASDVKRLLAPTSFLVQSLFAILACVWLFVILQLSSPGIIEVWEAVVTLLLYFVMVLMVWLVECKKSKVSEEEQDIENMRLIAQHSLVTRS
jgi:solute carrier family 8 (sodium/calcium exchanger)